MVQDAYLIDGQEYTAEAVKKLLAGGALGKREQVVLGMLEDVRADHTIVDLGCLYGSFARALREQFPDSRVIAGDYLEENLKISRLMNPHIADGFRILNAYALDLPSESVDILTFQEVIEHLEGAAHAVKEINRVLKKDGVLIVSTPTPYYWRDMWKSFKYELVKTYRRPDLPLSDEIYFKEHEWNRHLYCWTPSTLYTLLKVNGFEYVSHTYCQGAQGFIERRMLRLFPFLSPTIILQVKKISEAPGKLV